MKALALLLLLAPAAGALDADAPGVPARRAHDAVERLPAAARVELRRMFMTYREEVAKRLESGWSYGVLSDAVIENVGEPFQSARLLAESEKKRGAELESLQASAAKTNHDDASYGRLLRKIEDKKEELAKVRAQGRREKGICRDWSDDVWFLLETAGLDHWTVDDRRRGSRPFHTGAVACAPADAPSVCLVFDPWTRGKPDVYALDAWDAQEPGGRVPADYFLHGLPEKAP